MKRENGVIMSNTPESSSRYLRWDCSICYRLYKPDKYAIFTHTTLAIHRISLCKSYLPSARKKRTEGICDRIGFKGDTEGARVMSASPREIKARQSQRNERGWMREWAWLNGYTHEPESWLTGPVYLLMQHSPFTRPPLSSLVSGVCRRREVQNF